MSDTTKATRTSSDPSGGTIAAMLVGGVVLTGFMIYSGIQKIENMYYERQERKTDVLFANSKKDIIQTIDTITINGVPMEQKTIDSTYTVKASEMRRLGLPLPK